MEFLYELRHLVDVRDRRAGRGKLFATGRLFAVNKIDIEIVPARRSEPACADGDDRPRRVRLRDAAARPVPTTDDDNRHDQHDDDDASGSASAASAPTGGTS